VESFVITAIMPVRRRQRNEMKPPLPPDGWDLPIVLFKSQIEKRCQSFPFVIASNSQLQQGTQRTALNATVG
jgi:hypothetical protein